MATPQEKAQCVSWFIKTKSDLQTHETSELSIEEIYRHVHQFVRGTRNLWRQRQCSTKGGVDDQEYRRKTSIKKECKKVLDGQL